MYAGVLVFVVFALVAGLFLVYRFNYTQCWHGIPYGGFLDSLGLMLTIAGFVVFYLLVIPEEKHTEYRHRLGVASSMKGVADPLMDLAFDETAKKVTWSFPADACPLWVAITLYKGEAKDTFVRSGATVSFEDKLALQGVTKVTGWYGTPGGPSALTEWSFPVVPTKPAAKPASKP